MQVGLGPPFWYPLVAAKGTEGQFGESCPPERNNLHPGLMPGGGWVLRWIASKLEGESDLLYELGRKAELGVKAFVVFGLDLKTTATEHMGHDLIFLQKHGVHFLNVLASGK